MSLSITNPPQLINDYVFLDHVFNYYRIRIITLDNNKQSYVLLSDLTELLKINLTCVLIKELNDELAELKQSLELDNIDVLMSLDAPLMYDELTLSVIDVEGKLKNVIHLNTVDLVYKKSKDAIVPKFRQWFVNEIMPIYHKSFYERNDAADSSELIPESDLIVAIEAQNEQYVGEAHLYFVGQDVAKEDTHHVIQFFDVYQQLLNKYDLLLNHAPLNCENLIAINVASIYELAKTYQLLMPSKDELLKNIDDFFIDNKAFPYRLISKNAAVKSSIWYKTVNCFLFQLSGNNSVVKN